eukprot:PhF_6_TR4864/c0_g1_i2/m.6823
MAVIQAPKLPPEVALDPNGSHLHVTICIPGWTLSTETLSSTASSITTSSTAALDEHDLLWRHSMIRYYCQALSEMYYVKWESQHLRAFGELLNKTITSTAAKYGVGFWAVAASKVLNTLYGSIAWPYWLMWSADLIDSSFSIALDRAEKAGVLLAEGLASHAHGNRPVSLIAFSTGTVMVTRCLQELYNRGLFGIVSDVFLFGGTLSVQSQAWEQYRHVVRGRFVNAYSHKDWFLGFLMRTTKLAASGIAGLQPVPVSGIENVDVSSIVDSHVAYIHRLSELIAFVQEGGTCVMYLEDEHQMERATTRDDVGVVVSTHGVGMDA